MTTTKEPTSVDYLAGLAVQVRDEPTTASHRRLADACLIHATLHSGRLDPLVVHLTARMDELTPDAIIELDRAVVAETKRRAAQ